MAYATAISAHMCTKQLYELSDELANSFLQPECLSELIQIANFIKRFDFEENGVEGKYLMKEIRDALWRAEDIIESYVSNHLLSPEMIQSLNFSRDLLAVIQQIKPTKERMEMFADEFKLGKEKSIDTLTNDLPPVHKKKMIGLDQELNGMKEVLLGENKKYHFRSAIVLYGMAGIGKTSLAISAYNDSDLRRHFSIGAWVQISLQHSVRNILLNLLRTMEFFDNGRMMRDITNCIMAEEMNDEQLADFLREKFLLQRYLVVVDCVCDINPSSWDYIKSILPDSNNGSRILLVSRVELESDNEAVLGYYTKSFLDEFQSWSLLRQQVFGDEPCPSILLERIGKRIAKNCQGLPLAVITVGQHHFKEQKTVEYWNKVAETGNSIAYAANGAHMFEQIGLSYKQMPLHLRPIFLYMGAFPEREVFSLLELMKLLESELLLAGDEFPVKYLAWELFESFSKRHLLMGIQKDNFNMFRWSLHHILWHFCCNQAKKEEFFFVLNYEDDSNIAAKLRRLVIQNAVLFGIHGFFHKRKHSAVSIRSMLFTGPYHPYPLKRIVWGRYKMLRVLKASSIHFYEFPTEILSFKLLRYLSLTLSEGDLPLGISKLSNLETLIVCFHHTVRSCDVDPLHLPLEIWEMQQLIHLQVVGRDLPVPPHSDALLPNLLTLSDVTPHSCTRKVLKRIPKLTRLKIRTNFAPKGTLAPMFLFDGIVPPAELASVSFVISNPYFEENTGSPMFELPGSFPNSMKKLTNLSLSGCGFAWENIEPISQLPSLVNLEMRFHAFRGAKWELTRTGFKWLQHLILEDLDLIYWTTGSDHFFPCLSGITITRCHKLEQFPHSFVHCNNLLQISVVESSHAAENWARSIQMELSQTRPIEQRLPNMRMMKFTPEFIRVLQHHKLLISGRSSGNSTAQKADDKAAIKGNESESVTNLDQSKNESETNVTFKDGGTECNDTARNLNSPSGEAPDEKKVEVEVSSTSPHGQVMETQHTHQFVAHLNEKFETSAPPLIVRLTQSRTMSIEIASQRGPWICNIKRQSLLPTLSGSQIPRHRITKRWSPPLRKPEK